MPKRPVSINDVPIAEARPQFRWPPGRPDRAAAGQ
ncbi:MAG: hypothetical protein H7345_04605 [Rubritepida sp.]|nr:hypothetical protein [Rubritepida sp.]